MSTQLTLPLDVSVDAQGLAAWIAAAPDADWSAITPEDALESIAAAQIAVTDAVRARVGKFVDACRSSEGPSEKFLVAQGTAPVEGRHGEFQPDDDSESEPAPNPDDDHIDYRSLNTVRTVDKGQVIGTLIPAVPSAPGRNVFGKPIAPSLRTEDVKIGDNIRLDPDHAGRVIATESGTIIYRLGKLDIDEVVQIRGDIDYESGNVDATSHVHVRGTVRDLFTVKARKSITVIGAIEGAQVDAGEDLIVRGGIAGRGRARITAGASVAAKFCNEAELTAAGDITLGKEAMHSQLRAQGKLVAEHGNIVGGHIYARQGAIVRSLGNDNDVPTTITIGTHPDVLRHVRQMDITIDQLAESVEQIRTKVQPLMANLKRLTPQQKEQATELLFKADEMALDIEQKRSEQTTLLENSCPDAEPCVIVHSTVFPRVTIAIEGHQTHFTRLLKGPLRIERRKTKNVTECVAVNLLTGSVTRLPTTRVDLSREDEATGVL